MAVKAKANSPAAAGELTARQRKRKENMKLVSGTISSTFS